MLTVEGLFSFVLFVAAALIAIISLVRGRAPLGDKNATRAGQPVRYWIETLLVPAIVAASALLLSADDKRGLTLVNLCMLAYFAATGFATLRRDHDPAYDDRVGRFFLRWALLAFATLALAWLLYDLMTHPPGSTRLKS